MPKKTFTFRISEDQRNRLDEAAAAQGRTSSNLVSWIIQQWLDEHCPKEENEANPSPEKE